MGIRNASIALGATFSPTGGAATSLVLMSNGSGQATAFIAAAGVTPLTRTDLTFQAKPSKVAASAPGGFTQGRSSVKLTVPKVLANLKRTLNSASIEISIDPETTAVELAAIKSNLINILNDADFDQLWLNQSLD